MTPGEVLSVVAAVCAVLTVLFSAVASRRAAKRDNRQDGAMLSDIGYIKAGIDDMKRHAEEADKRHYELENRMEKRVTAVEQSVKQAHHRIDRIEKHEKFA